MKHIFLFVLISSFFLSGAVAQNIDFTKENFPYLSRSLKSALKSIQSGDKIYHGKDNTVIKYKQALDYYNKAQQINPNNASLNIKIAYCYYNLNDLFPSLSHGLRAYELDSSLRGALFFKGYQLHLQNQFDEALVYYNAFKSAGGITSEEMYMVTRKVKECEAGKILLKTETNCFIDNLGQAVNTPFDEYMPIILGKDSLLYFVSRKENEKGISSEDGKHREYIYFSFGDKDGDFFPASPFEKKLSKDFEALQAISRDGKRAILYSTKNGGDLYEVEIRNGKWMSPKPISAINTMRRLPL